MNQLGKTITSLEVAEMVSRRHDQVLRDIRTIISHLGDDHKSVEVETYFVQSDYEDKKGETRDCYLLTKKGCELYSTRMTGEKGTQFAVAYIERFNQMENHIKKQTDQLPMNNTKLLLETALKHEIKLESIESDVSYLKGSMRIDSLQQQEIQASAKRSIVRALGGGDSIAYQEMSKKVFSAFWREFKQHFKVPRYGDIPKVKFDEAVRFIELWRPSTSLQIEIEQCNSQMIMA